MPTFSRRTKIIAAFVIIIVVGYGFAMFWKVQNGVPSDFTAARLQGAIIAQTIVNSSNQSTEELKAINQYDQQGDYTDALASTTELIYQSASLRDEAVQLSTQVSQMATSLPNIKSADAQKAALQSITNRLSLINELITYSNDLDHLLTVLQARFRGVSQPNGEVSTIVDQINADVNLINNFNAQAGQAMDKFDSIEKGK
jgi:DNA repair ATPase RecN